MKQFSHFNQKDFDFFHIAKSVLLNQRRWGWRAGWLAVFLDFLVTFLDFSVIFCGFLCDFLWISLWNVLRVFYWIKEDEGGESWLCFCTFIIQSTSLLLPHKAQNYSFWCQIFSQLWNLEIFFTCVIKTSPLPQSVHNAFPAVPLGSCNMNKLTIDFHRFKDTQTGTTPPHIGLKYQPQNTSLSVFHLAI